MKPKLSYRDYQQISLYLDGGLSLKDRARFECRLQHDNDLKQGFLNTQQAQSLLKNLPKVRAPHNFTLTPAMVGKTATRTPQLPRSFYTLRLSALLSSVLLVFVILGDLFSHRVYPPFVMMAPAPAQVEQMAVLATAPSAEKEMDNVPPGTIEIPGIETSLPLGPAAADLVASNVQTTMPSTAAGVEPVPAAPDFPLVKESAAIQTPEELPTTALSAGAPAESMQAAAPLPSPSVGNETSTPYLLPTPTQNKLPTLTQALEEKATPYIAAQPSKTDIILRVLEIFLTLLILATAISAWWVHRNSHR